VQLLQLAPGLGKDAIHKPIVEFVGHEVRHVPVLGKSRNVKLIVENESSNPSLGIATSHTSDIRIVTSNNHIPSIISSDKLLIESRIRGKEWIKTLSGFVFQFNSIYKLRCNTLLRTIPSHCIHHIIGNWKPLLSAHFLFKEDHYD
jgi:hypothetical protein